MRVAGADASRCDACADSASASARPVHIVQVLVPQVSPETGTGTGLVATCRRCCCIRLLSFADAVVRLVCTQVVTGQVESLL